LEKRGLRVDVHMMRHPRGWATDVTILEAAEAQGAVLHRIVTADGECWTAPLRLFHEYGVEIERGFGPQRLLPERYWRREPLGKQQLALFTEVA
jgi:hypothetical protein